MFNPSDARHLTISKDDWPLIVAWHPKLDLVACIEPDGRPFIYYQGNAYYTDPQRWHPAQIVVRATWLPETQAINWMVDVCARRQLHRRQSQVAA